MGVSGICAICESSNLVELFKLLAYPAYIVPVPFEIAKDVVKADLPLHQCGDCGHMQVVNPDPDLQQRIYEEYYSYYVVDSSESFNPHYRIPFKEFLEGLKESGALKGKEKLLEIGCSSGKQSAFLKGFVKYYYGIDPSEKIHEAIADFPDDTFIKGYFPAAISKITFDVIVSQFNLEHILDVRDFVGHVYTTLNNNGIVILQVPDIEDFLRNKQPNFMAHEHLQYFKKNTLKKLLESQGFEIVAWGKEGPSLIVAAKKSSSQNSYDFGVGLDQLLKNAANQVHLFKALPTNLPKNVLFYGVGPQLYWLLGNIGNNLEDFLICDDNPKYEEQGLPGYNKMVFRPSQENLRKYPNVVLTLNRIYHSQVLEKLKRSGLNLNIYQFSSDGQWKLVSI